MKLNMKTRITIFPFLLIDSPLTSVANNTSRCLKIQKNTYNPTLILTLGNIFIEFRREIF